MEKVMGKSIPTEKVLAPEEPVKSKTEEPAKPTSPSAWKEEQRVRAAKAKAEAETGVEIKKIGTGDSVKYEVKIGDKTHVIYRTTGESAGWYREDAGPHSTGWIGDNRTDAINTLKGKR
jgi:hypothetical protein